VTGNASGPCPCSLWFSSEAGGRRKLSEDCLTQVHLEMAINLVVVVEVVVVVV